MFTPQGNELWEDFTQPLFNSSSEDDVFDPSDPADWEEDYSDGYENSSKEFREKMYERELDMVIESKKEILKDLREAKASGDKELIHQYEKELDQYTAKSKALKKLINDTQPGNTRMGTAAVATVGAAGLSFLARNKESS